MPDILMQDYLTGLDRLKAEVTGMSKEQQFDRLAELTVQLRLTKEKWQQIFDQSQTDRANDYSGELAKLLDQVHDFEQQIDNLRTCIEEDGKLGLRDPQLYQDLDQTVAERLEEIAKSN
ncbi:MAG: hypothetical protein WC675_01215 [Patescibacteria group bacterium]|jgi:hypothetical protein